MEEATDENWTIVFAEGDDEEEMVATAAEFKGRIGRVVKRQHTVVVGPGHLIGQVVRHGVMEELKPVLVFYVQLDPLDGITLRVLEGDPELRPAESAVPDDAHQS
jgi:hypothetical protein